MTFYPFQIEVLEATKKRNRAAYYLDMGLGKTFIGAEKLKRLNADTNLIVCQKSKIQDWIDHFKTHYPTMTIRDLTKPLEFDDFL
ncbi:MAG: ATP-dependent helicase, partial [Kiritimatiellia bacterium]